MSYTPYRKCASGGAFHELTMQICFVRGGTFEERGFPEGLPFRRSAMAQERSSSLHHFALRALAKLAFAFIHCPTCPTFVEYSAVEAGVCSTRRCLTKSKEDNVITINAVMVGSGVTPAMPGRFPARAVNGGILFKIRVTRRCLSLYTRPCAVCHRLEGV
jgi:hypothetical protein